MAAALRESTHQTRIHVCACALNVNQLRRYRAFNINNIPKLIKKKQLP